MKDYDAALLKHRGENVLITRTKTVHLDKCPAFRFLLLSDFSYWNDDKI